MVLREIYGKKFRLQIREISERTTVVIFLIFVVKITELTKNILYPSGCWTIDVFIAIEELTIFLFLIELPLNQIMKFSSQFRRIYKKIRS